MTLTFMLQENHLKDRRVQFIQTHQQAFDVEPTFILSLFEEAVLGIEGTCGVEPMCHVEADQLFAVDFQVSNEEHTWPRSWTDAVKFLDKVESQIGVRLNRDLLEKFVAVHIGSHKIVNNTIGIDLRPRHEDSCIKIYMHIEFEEYPEELVRTAIELDGGSYSSDLLQVLLKSTIVIGFNMFLNGYSNVELWPAALGDKYKSHILNRGKYLKDYIQKKFSPKVNSILKKSTLLAVSFSKAKNVEPLLIFHSDDIKDIRKYFSFNSLGDRIYSFCLSQDCITSGGVVLTESELEKNRLENFSIFYNERDQCRQDLPSL
ncbi:LynF/TruF/PatF family peptide O-prenyltransferase [Capilliphycus salinus ALCB114379]|uniref:LynF/TruF/PatF family peptide O-prenyltransferase n=1 Tax=Capilliphycus salinus TaxID=2768948 RepID=UPI0039A43887